MMIRPDSRLRIKRHLATTGLLPAVRTLQYGLRWLSDPSFRHTDHLHRRDYQAFLDRHAAMFRRISAGADPGGRRVLVVSLGSLGQLVEIALAKSFELAGYHPIVLSDYDRWVDRYYRAAGIRDLIYWDEFLCPIEQDAAQAALETIRSFEHLVKFDYRGARVGKYAASTALRQLRAGRLDLSAQDTRAAVLPFLQRAMQYAEACERVVQAVRPHVALSVDPGYTPRGELFDLCLASGTDTITWNAAHKNNTLMLKRYSPANRDVHPASLSNDTWTAVKQMAWTPAHAARLRRELIGTYVSGEWYSEVGTQFHTALREADDLRRDLALDPAKKTAVIFPHIFWDGTFFWGTDLFSSYEEWFVETMRVACSNRAVNWIVKVHPANLVKNVRDGVRSEPSEAVAIRQIADPLPPHIRVIPPDSPISTLSLYGVVDYCVTVRGTVGIEAAAFGIPVLTAGTGRYDRLGFTIDSQSKAQYLERLAHLQDVPVLSAPQRELAERFAYGLFLMRPLKLCSVGLEYRRDPKASARMAVQWDGMQGLEAAPDLRMVAEWVTSGREDFVEPHVE